METTKKQAHAAFRELPLGAVKPRGGCAISCAFKRTD